ncbi:hypothetical protein C1645_820958 [Glomus cerebriforme]|uniref:Uncharacterized protein n=1 Tax=Glomus cerebriforme TaxID=658196 RepID=A0A397T7P5_9GLOM|nr:hypothetical protein C1645_820958 [Glomus cerebriforme]
MDYNNPLQNNNTHPNNLQSPQMNQYLSNDNVNASCSYTDYFPTADNNIIPASNTCEQQLSFANNFTIPTSFPYANLNDLNVRNQSQQDIPLNIFTNNSQISFANSGHTSSTAQFLSYAHHAPQYTGYDHQNIFPTLGSFDTIANSSQTNHPRVFRFEIPGFEIIIKSTTFSYANLNNLDMQNQPTQN